MLRAHTGTKKPKTPIDGARGYWAAAPATGPRCALRARLTAFSPPMRAWLEQPHGRRHKAPPQPCALTTDLGWLVGRGLYCILQLYRWVGQAKRKETVRRWPDFAFCALFLLCPRLLLACRSPTWASKKAWSSEKRLAWSARDRCGRCACGGKPPAAWTALDQIVHGLTSPRGGGRDGLDTSVETA